MYFQELSRMRGNRVFMHYFHNLSLASGGFVHIPPPGLYPWTPLGDFGPQTLNLPTLEKILRRPWCTAAKNSQTF